MSMTTAGATTPMLFIILTLWAASVKLIAAASTPFPHTKVISLPNHKERRKQITNELSSKNVPFTWMTGIDGRNLTQSELSVNATPLARWFLTPGMIGCFLSHRECWKRCVDSGEPILIFEDDVILAPNFRSMVMAAMNHLNCTSSSSTNISEGGSLEKCTKNDHFDWDVLLLGAMGCVHPRKLKYGLNWIPSLVGGNWRRTRHIGDISVRENIDKKETQDKTVLHLPMCPYGMHAYVISPRGAAKLLERCPRASYHVDVVAWGFKELNILALHPLIAWQTNNDTTIGGSKRWSILPRVLADRYTGFDLVWALNGPLLRLGGPFLGGKLLLTNGNSLALMFAGLVVGIKRKSQLLLYITFIYVALVTATIRFLSSTWNN